MFELSNAQRECFGLVPVHDHWERIEAKPAPHDYYKTHLYLDGDAIVKCIISGDSIYSECELAEKLSPDRKYLLPKTTKGKPVILSSANVLKRKGIGMCLAYANDFIDLYNENTERAYYTNYYCKDDINDLAGFVRWVEKWCDETTLADREDVLRFSRKKREHVRYREGDVFRFKINRKQYGYGRLLLDYGLMKKKKEPFWDVLMFKPLVCSVYHIITERDDVPVEELEHLGSLPSTIVADNALFYGEHEIVGNLPPKADEYYPIMYGTSLSVLENAICYQCGKLYRKIDNEPALFSCFHNNGVSFKLNLTQDVLQQCITEKSNEPYWKQYYPGTVEQDLRNPKHAEKLKQIKKQFGL